MGLPLRLQQNFGVGQKPDNDVSSSSRSVRTMLSQLKSSRIFIITIHTSKKNNYFWE